MAQPYFDRLAALVEKHLPTEPNLEVKHFFNGAALYSNGAICASLTPVGLAFKLPLDKCAHLIESGAASPLRYFEKSPVKVGYALFPYYELLGDDEIEGYFEVSAANTRLS